MSDDPVVGVEYDASQIELLPALQAVRQKPGMYFGSTDERGLHHGVWYIVQEAVDQLLNGHGSTIAVVIEPDGSISIEDDGPGISVKPRNRIPFIECYLGSLHSGDGGRSGAGLAIFKGVGPNCVNAVSEWFRAETTVDGNTYVIEYRQGNVTRLWSWSDLPKKRGLDLHLNQTLRFFVRQLFSMRALSKSDWYR